MAVCGGKGTGKSTLTRYLTHRLLSDESGRVLYLDLDMGQPETSPPGLVSLSLIRGPLLGPPHTHMASAHGDGAAVVTTLRSYFLGDVTTRHVRIRTQTGPHRLLPAHYDSHIHPMSHENSNRSPVCTRRRCMNCWPSTRLTHS